jgi:hypothetical protein
MALSRLQAQVSTDKQEAGQELANARAALATLSRLDAEPSWRHVWLRVLGQERRQATLNTISQALARAETLTDQRAVNEQWRAQLADRLAHVATLPELTALSQALMAGPPHSEAPLPISAVAELQETAEQTAVSFKQDDQRNADAVAQVEALLHAAGADVARLQLVLDAVLPRPDRQPQVRSLALSTLQSEAQTQRTRALLQRVQAREAAARQAPSAAQVRVELTALERDPDLRRAVPDAVGLDAARERIAARANALDEWERGRRTIETLLDQDDPAGAARALADLRAPDEEHGRQLGELRVGFGARAAYVVARAMVRHGEAGDWAGARRLLAAMREDGAVAALLDQHARSALVRSEEALNQSEDRVLYEEFRATPRAELAGRYLDGWPGVTRRMAPHVQEYLAWLDKPVTELVFEAVEWQTVGSAPSAITDLPDATLELRIDGQPRAITRIEDVRDRTKSTLLEPIRITLSQSDAQVVRVGAVVRIDLRDVLDADPLATGAVDVSPAELRAARSLVLPVVDTAWSPKPHRLFFRVAGIGTPALPPWQP